jgi:lipoate-protein ligase B
MHGLAINVTSDLSNYERIIPCGITVEGKGVCSVKQSNPVATVDIMLDAFLKSFGHIFDLEYERCSLSSLKGTMDMYPTLSGAKLDKVIE